jgi:3-deoxy-D-manno-octulosonic-acid transferase
MAKAQNKTATTFRLALYLATRARSEGRYDPDDPDARERHAREMPPRPDGPLVWVHTGGDAEARAVREMAQRVLSERGDVAFLLTTSAGQRAEAQDKIQSQYIPADTTGAARRFLDHWRPSLALWTEADLRPALIHEAHRRDIPLMMVETQSAPARTGDTWSRGVSADVLGLFQALFAGDARSAARLRQMGARPGQIEILGFLQEGSPAPTCNEAERDDLAAQLGGRPTWLAASVTEDELSAVIDAHRQALRRSQRLLLILVPAHEAAGPDWTARLIEEGFVVALRSLGEEPEADTQIYVADSEEEMGLWYRLAPISFLGSSLFRGDGISPYEAAALGSAIVHGAHVGAHRDAYQRFTDAGAARLVRSAAGLGTAVEALLSPARAAEMAHRGWAVSSEGAGVTDRVIDLVLTEIETL